MTKSKKIILFGLIISLTTILIMGLFSFFKKTPEQITSSTDPYKDSSTNLIYNLLFCDNLDLYKNNTKPPYTYPFDILFSETSAISDLQKIIDDSSTDARLKVLSYNRQIASGHKPIKKELLAVIVEVGLDTGLDALASFNDGTARYINQTGKILVWETTDEKSNELTQDLFLKSQNIVNQIGAWDKPRRPAPTKGNVRITFLVSDGLYFGEGPIDVLFNDPMASPALTSATYLMKYLTEKSLETK
ncbi:hypothetical protein [Maribacter sp. IgM3_T14_3]|uniref:hypothetical protein n=1 Tax=Maribacter sp. IgM3_T14_3 TaxID=3415140 RepID=UPI003C70418A